MATACGVDTWAENSPTAAVYALARARGEADDAVLRLLYLRLCWRFGFLPGRFVRHS